MGSLVRPPKTICIHFWGGQRMAMECCLQWRPRIQMYRGKETQENGVRHSIYQNLIFQKDWKEDPFLLLQSQNFVTIQDLAVIPSSYFLTIGQGLRNEGLLDASFQADWISMQKEMQGLRQKSPPLMPLQLMSYQYHLALLGHPQPKSSGKLSK